jgi:hypothetical protein
MTQLSLLDTPPTAVFRRPPEPIERSADLEGDFRWSLTRRWGNGPAALWCGANPSRADAEIDDQTMWRVMTFSWSWGYGAAVMVNVYPFITPHLTELRRWLAGDHAIIAEVMRHNVAKVAAADLECRLHMAAWGNLIEAAVAARFVDDVDRALSRRVVWHCLRPTRDGAPTHPMARGKHRVPDDAKRVVWRR